MNPMFIFTILVCILIFIILFSEYDSKFMIKFAACIVGIIFCAVAMHECKENLNESSIKITNTYNIAQFDGNYLLASKKNDTVSVYAEVEDGVYELKEVKSYKVIADDDARVEYYTVDGSFLFFKDSFVMCNVYIPKEP